jgi:hypothetical protein
MVNELLKRPYITHNPDAVLPEKPYHLFTHKRGYKAFTLRGTAHAALLTAIDEQIEICLTSAIKLEEYKIEVLTW